LNRANAAHIWYNAPGGTAGNAVTFTQAMTLTSAGDLLVGTTSTSPTALGVRVIASATIPQISVAVSAASNNYVLYNTTAAAYRFFVSDAGTISATNTTISAISDKRLKENIRDLDDGLPILLKLKPRKFDWKEGKGKDIKNDRGFIAQEFEEIFPDLIDTWNDEPPAGEEPYKAVRADLIPVLVKAVQELHAEIESLKQRIN
jgi:hypothetical protein